MHSTQVKNKRTEMFKVAAIEPELYCKITPMYKCCLHQTNQCLVKKQCQIQLNRKNDLFKVSKHIVNAKETKPVTHVLLK